MSDTEVQAVDAPITADAHDATVAIGEQTPADEDQYARKIALQKAAAIASATRAVEKARQHLKDAELALAVAQKENA